MSAFSAHAVPRGGRPASGGPSGCCRVGAAPLGPLPLAGKAIQGLALLWMTARYSVSSLLPTPLHWPHCPHLPFCRLLSTRSPCFFFGLLAGVGEGPGCTTSALPCVSGSVEFPSFPPGDLCPEEGGGGRRPPSSGGTCLTGRTHPGAVTIAAGSGVGYSTRVL